MCLGSFLTFLPGYRRDRTHPNTGAALGTGVVYLVVLFMLHNGPGGTDLPTGTANDTVLGYMYCHMILHISYISTPSEMFSRFSIMSGNKL